MAETRVAWEHPESYSQQDVQRRICEWLVFRYGEHNFGSDFIRADIRSTVHDGGANNVPGNDMVPHLAVDFYVWTDPVGGGAPEIKDYVRHVRFWRLDYLNDGGISLAILQQPPNHPPVHRCKPKHDNEDYIKRPENAIIPVPTHAKELSQEER
ncbi:hypothetical protein DFH11DRAFT_1728355 [Phellopilus nigrolimitatus]|nr:hypothetical protein DFH11DRAFT_1728355 [Phellopilus nigrolimitatus]